MRDEIIRLIEGEPRGHTNLVWERVEVTHGGTLLNAADNASELIPQELGVVVLAPAQDDRGRDLLRDDAVDKEVKVDVVNTLIRCANQDDAKYATRGTSKLVPHSKGGECPPPTYCRGGARRGTCSGGARH